VTLEPNLLFLEYPPKNNGRFQKFNFSKEKLPHTTQKQQQQQQL
jgi:hypothetical protein